MITVTGARKQQLDYIGIAEEDLAYLHSHRESFARVTEHVVNELYDRINSQPELAAIITAHSTLERLKKTQIWYFQSMTGGLIDQEFIDRRLHIGGLHSRIGLTTNWYLGTYMLYLDIATKYFKQESPEHWPQIVFKLSKMFNLDSQLVLEAYEQAEKAIVQRMADERQHIITQISSAVQHLASMMVELSDSTQAVAKAATYTVELQESTQDRVESLHSQIEDIQIMGTVIRDVATQTHLLGFNAAIEAARAGEAGRGFQIVAEEIRKLADSSKSSSKTIQTKLKEIAALLSEVKESTNETVNIAKEQASSSQELAAFVQVIESITEDLGKLH